MCEERVAQTGESADLVDRVNKKSLYAGDTRTNLAGGVGRDAGRRKKEINK